MAGTTICERAEGTTNGFDFVLNHNKSHCRQHAGEGTAIMQRKTRRPYLAGLSGVSSAGGMCRDV